MKKEYVIVYDIPTSGDVICLTPFLDKKFPTEKAAEDYIDSIFKSQGAILNKQFYIIPCYSKA